MKTREKTEKKAEGCPLHAVHQRLEDLHRQWHQAEEAYFDPDGFRVAIQTAIQTARTVTFILQSNKHVIPDFEKWYAGWQSTFKENSLMRWMVDARNKIEKQGDLESHSFVRAEIVASYLENGPVVEVPAKLFDAPLKLIKSIPDTAAGKHVKEQGLLRIQRRWVENTLPDYELLDAVATAYGLLSDMLDDAHRQIGLPVPVPIDAHTGEKYDSESMKGCLPCMIGHSDARTLNLWLADGKPMEVEAVTRSVSEEDMKKSVERYDLQENMFDNSETPEGMLNDLFSTASKMFLKDGYHVTVMFLLRDGKLIQMIELAPVDHGDKYLMMRKLAHEVKKKGADGAILLGEVWMAPFDSKHPYRRSVDSPDRQEALVAKLITKNAEPKQISAIIHRDGKTVKLDKSIEQTGGAHYMFAPFYEVWGRKIPQDWLDGTHDGTKADNEKNAESE